MYLPRVFNKGRLNVWVQVKLTSVFSRRCRIVNALCEEGNACYAQSDYETAERKYRQALRAEPNHVRSLCCLAWLLKNEKNDMSSARGLIARACEIDPNVR
jgi:hypothetical protein